MKLRQFTPRQPITDIPSTPRELQPDPEGLIKHDDLYARAWECEYDEPIFLTAITIIWQHLVHPKLQYDLSKQLTK